MAKKSAYTFAQLAEIYRRYAALKGWSTKDEVVHDKVQSWLDSSIGPVGLAIEFYETKKDSAKHLGYDAEARAVDAGIQTAVTKLAGTEHANEDGVSRQAILRHCALFEPLRLQHEPTNPYDSNAIAVFRENGQQLGYLPRQMAARIVSEGRLGCRYVAAIQSLGPGRGQPDEIWDATAVLFRIKPGVSDQELETYYDAWVAGMQGS